VDLEILVFIYFKLIAVIDCVSI